MVFKLIACNVFTREACLCVANSPHTIDLEFTQLGEHARPELLRRRLQAMIDAAEAETKKYDAILLLFGLCGNATLDLQARKTPLVIPRAHDCCAVLLGSRARFEEHFRHRPSTPFSSVGYMERGEYLLHTPDDQSEMALDDPFAAYVKEYGEENAQYIWDTLHPEGHDADAAAVFIDLPELAHLAKIDTFAAEAAKRHLRCETLPGDLTLVRQLIDGHWPADDFLILQPGQQIAAVYDWQEILRAK